MISFKLFSHCKEKKTTNLKRIKSTILFGLMLFVFLLFGLTQNVFAQNAKNTNRGKQIEGTPKKVNAIDYYLQTSFETGGGWTLNPTGGNNDWNRRSTTAFDGSYIYDTHTGAGSDYRNNHNDYLYNSTDITLPSISAGENLVVSFREYSEYAAGDYGEVLVSTNGGSSWSSALSTITGNTGSSGNWRLTKINLNAYSGQGIRIGFHHVTNASGTDNGWRVDSINVYYVHLPAAPTGLLPSGAVTGSPQSLSWNNVTGATSYDLQWKLSSSPTWTTVTGVTNPYSLTVSNGNSYDFHVRTNDAQGSSAYSSTSTFTVTIINNATFSGHVYSSHGHGVNGITLNLTERITPPNYTVVQTITTYHDATQGDGWYTFSYYANGDRFRVEPPANYDLDVNPGAYSTTTGNHTQNFNMNYSIEGYAGTSTMPPEPPTSPLSGILVTMSCPVVPAVTESVTTDATGYYCLPALTDWQVGGGTYYTILVTPTDVNWQFNPSVYARGYGQPWPTGYVDFYSVNLITIGGGATLSGSVIRPTGVTYDPALLAGVQLAIQSNAPHNPVYHTYSTLSGTTGVYSLQLPQDSQYTTTPAKSGFTFSPASITTNGILTKDSTLGPFTMIPNPYTISGQLDSAGTKMNGWTVRLDSSDGVGGWIQVRTSVTAGAGNYSLTVYSTGDYRVVPVKLPTADPAFFFYPTYASFTNPAKNYTQDFIYSATIRTISGTVYLTTYGGSQLANAEITMTQTNGSFNATAFSAANGYYEFPALDGGIYTITIQKTGYNFAAYAPFTGTVGPVAADYTTAHWVATIQRYLIQGDVTFAGALAGVAMNPTLIGGAGTITGTLNPTNTSSPNYIITVDALGSYQIAPSLAGYVFSPVTAQFLNLTGPGPYTQNFTSTSPYPPTLNYPGNTAIGVEVNPAFNWSAPSPGAPVVNSPVSYDIQLATTINFTGIVINGTTTNGGNTWSYTSNLAYNTQYYWHVRDYNAVGATNWSTTYTFKTGLIAPVPIDPLNNKTVSVSPTLTWNTSEGATDYDVAIYTSSDYTGTAVASYNTTQTSWSVSPPLTVGIHYWWTVRAHSTQGPVYSPWSSQSYPGMNVSFTTSDLIPQLYKPDNMSTIGTYSPTLEWWSINGENSSGDQYIVQVSKYSDFSSVDYTITQSATSGTNPEQWIVTLTNTPNQRWFWRVAAIINNAGFDLAKKAKINKINGEQQPWSDVWSFTTGLAVPVPVSPLNNVYVPVLPTFQWQTSTGAEDYEIVVYKQSDPTTPVRFWTYGTIGGNTTWTTPDGVPYFEDNGAYFWGVRAHKYDPLVFTHYYSAWSHEFYAWSSYDPRFRIDAAIPILDQPANTSYISDLRPWLVWHLQNPPADQNNYNFQVEVSTSLGFAAGSQKWLSGWTAGYAGPTMTVQVPAGILGYDITYYWRVHSQGKTGEMKISEWSTPFNFTTTLLPPKPLIPIDDNTVSVAPTLLWETSSGASDYTVEVYLHDNSHTYSPANFVTRATGVTSTSWTLPTALTNNAHYLWRVQAWATNDVTSGRYSSQWSNVYWGCSPTMKMVGLKGDNDKKKLSIACVNAAFWTSAAIPVLKAPPNGEVGTSVKPKFEWYAAAGADKYQLQYWKDGAGATDTVITADLSALFYGPLTTALPKETLYFWKVRAKNAAGQYTAWSTVWNFHTTGAKLSIDPKRLDFDSTVIGRTATKYLTVSNNGGAEDLYIGGLEFAGNQKESFTTTTPLPIKIPADGTPQQIAVLFHPTHASTHTATLYISHNDASLTDNPFPIPLTGLVTATMANLKVKSPLNFGQVPLLSGYRDTILALTNSSPVHGDYLIITNLYFQTADNFFAVLDAFPIYIDAGNTYNLHVRFYAKAAQTGTVTNTLHIINSSLNPDATCQVIATLYESSLHVEPMSINFGTNPVIRTQGVKIVNIGPTPITINSKTLTGDTASYQLTNNTFPVTLSPGAPGGTDSLVVVFSPHSVGKKDAQLVINSNNPGANNLYVDITGIEGESPVLYVSPTSIDFGEVSPGETKDTTILIRNDGAADLVITSKSFQGDAKDLFTFVNDGGAVTLRTDEVQNVKIRIKGALPVGNKIAAMRIACNDPNNATFDVALTAIIRSKTLTKSTSRIEFDTVVVGYSKDTTFTITNNGNLTLVISQLYIDGTFASDFSLVDLPTLPINLNAGQQIIVKLRFTPLAAGQRFARVVINSNDPLNPEQTIILRGVGKIISPEISVIPEILDFGRLQLMETLTKDLTMSNKVQFSKLTIDSIYLDAIDNQPFSFTGLTLPLTLESGINVVLKVTFHPTAKQKSYTGFLNIRSNDPKHTIFKVQLLGSVDYPGMSINLPQYLDFADVKAKSTTTKSFDITCNSGNYVTIDSMVIIGKNAGEFKVISPTFPVKIFNGEKATITVQYIPQNAGTPDAKIKIYSNDIFNYAEIKLTAVVTTASGQTTEVKIADAPTVYSLSQNYPNPFNPTTRIEYGVPENTFVSVKVYNSIGQEISTLINKEQTAGVYYVEWHPDNLPSGLYFYRMQTSQYTQLKKMLYVR